MRILPVLCRPLAAPLVLLLAAAPLQAQGSGSGSGSAPGAGSGFAVGHAQSTGSLFSLHRVSTDTSTAAGSSLRLRTRTNAVAPLALDVSKFVFTAPGRAAASRTQTVERSFTFTPARTGRNGVSVGISTAATVAPTAATAAATAASGQLPSAYNFDLSVGYRGFALSGGLSRADGGLAGRDQEAVNVGIGYDARRWRAGVSAMAERSFPNLLPDALSPDSRYAVEARGALDLTSRISLGGSLRYRAAPQHPTPLDPNRDDRAVMLGGAVTF